MKKLLTVTLSIAAVLFLWEMYSRYVNSSVIIPAPKLVLNKILYLIINSNEFKVDCVFTFLRIATAFLTTLFLSIGTGYLSGKNSLLRDFLSFPVAIVKSTPVVAVILLLNFALSSSSIPVVSAVLMSFPILYETSMEGWLNGLTNKKQLEMAATFKFTKYQIFKYILFPEVFPFIKAGTVSLWGTCWKVVIAGEVLSYPKRGTGSFLFKSLTSLDTTSIFAGTIIMVIVSFAIEGIIKWILKSKN